MLINFKAPCYHFPISTSTMEGFSMGGGVQINAWDSFYAVATYPNITAAVADITADVLSPTEVSVSWDTVLPDDNNITMYQVLYQPRETFGGAINASTVDVGLNTSVTLTGLQEFVNYSISVQAFPSTGEACPYSESITVLTMEDGIRIQPQK